MRILVVHNYYQHKGGEDVVFQQEVEALRENHQVETITFQNRKGIKGLLQFALYPWNFFAANKIVAKAKYFKADIVHFHNIHYAIGPWAFRKLHQAGFKTAMTLHNYRLLCPSATLFFDGKIFTASLHQDFPKTALSKKVLDHSWLKTFITAFVYYFHRKVKTWDMVNKFIVLSDFAKNIFLTSRFGLQKSKFAIKPNFVPQPVELENNTDNHFLYVGRLSEEKGILPLLEAIKDTTHQLKILGTGPQLEEVLAIVNSSRNLEYLGFLPQEDISKALNNCSVLLVPSVCYEGMPMSIIEAFALGVPVLSSNIGILAEMVQPYQTGLHFDIYDKNNIIDTLQRWDSMSDEDKDRIKENCKLEYYSRYTEQHNINLLEKIYSDVINENK